MFTRILRYHIHFSGRFTLITAYSSIECYLSLLWFMNYGHPTHEEKKCNPSIPSRQASPVKRSCAATIKVVHWK
jgi:hypothetical protein